VPAEESPYARHESYLETTVLAPYPKLRRRALILEAYAPRILGMLREILSQSSHLKVPAVSSSVGKGR